MLNLSTNAASLNWSTVMHRPVLIAALMGCITACAPGTPPVGTPAGGGGAGGPDLADRAIADCPPVLVLNADSLSANLSVQLPALLSVTLGGEIGRAAAAAVTNASALDTYYESFSCRAAILNREAAAVSPLLADEALRAWSSVYRYADSSAARVADAALAHMARLDTVAPQTFITLPIPGPAALKAFQQNDLLTMTSVRTTAGISLADWAGPALRDASVSFKGASVEFAVQQVEGNTRLAAQSLPQFWRTYLVGASSQRVLARAVVRQIYDIGIQLAARADSARRAAPAPSGPTNR